MNAFIEILRDPVWQFFGFVIAVIALIYQIVQDNKKRAAKFDEDISQYQPGKKTRRKVIQRNIIKPPHYSLWRLLFGTVIASGGLLMLYLSLVYIGGSTNWIWFIAVIAMLAGIMAIRNSLP